MFFCVCHLLCVCRPASYGSWQAVTATKVEGPSKEPGPYLYSGITCNDNEPDDDDDDDDENWHKPTILTKLSNIFAQILTIVLPPGKSYLTDLQGATQYQAR